MNSFKCEVIKKKIELEDKTQIDLIFQVWEDGYVNLFVEMKNNEDDYHFYGRYNKYIGYESSEEIVEEIINHFEEDDYEYFEDIYYTKVTFNNDFVWKDILRTN